VAVHDPPRAAAVVSVSPKGPGRAGYKAQHRQLVTPGAPSHSAAPLSAVSRTEAAHLRRGPGSAAGRGDVFRIKPSRESAQ
jgi:hypothetical protein